jgi:hypothetical protein
MSYIRVSVLISALVTLSVFAATEDLIAPYLRIQAALSSDQLDGVKKDATEIAAEAAKIGAPAAKVQDAARKLEGAGDLKAARDAFGSLSEALVNYLDATKTSPGADVRVASCPMVRKPWLQKGDTIRNPYFGKQMPTCGEFRAKK